MERYLIRQPPLKKARTDSPTPQTPEAKSSNIPSSPMVRAALNVTPTTKLNVTPTTKKSFYPSEARPSPGFQSASAYQASPRLESPRVPFSPRVIKPSKQDNATDQSDSIQHVHLTYKFLQPGKRLDINKRPPDHPDYDERTLYVPSSFLDQQTPALRQWWLIKQRHMDSILFFKMGKFYELFNEDAVIGVENLDINYMKGDETKPAHAGFPEISYEKYSKMLVERGFKVIRIEQTETPAMVEERCQRTNMKGKFDRVVAREVCRITSRGTQMLGVMDSVFHSAHDQYLMSICESNVESSSATAGPRLYNYGFCFIDVTIGQLYIGQFEDDRNLSKLNILLAHHTPAEVLYERGNLDQQAIKSIMSTGALLTQLRPKREFWPIKTALQHLKSKHIFKDEKGQFEFPALLKSLFVGGEESEGLLVAEPKQEYELALKSFGALVYYLQSQLIDDQVLTCAQFELYQSPLQSNGLLENKNARKREAPPMIVDHIALRNLEIFENSAGGTSATLFESINNCKTHFGQRLLKKWLCSPLCDTIQIENRLDAVEALMDNSNASLMNEISHVLNQTPDLERLLSKIKNQCFKSESDSRAIMFDSNQYSKAKIGSFLNLLQNFKRMQKFIASVKFQAKNCQSKVLQRLLCFTTDDGLYPDYSATLDYFENAFDHETAKKTGQIIPAPGVDQDYDRCQEEIEKIKGSLDDYLETQKKVLKCRQLQYFGSAKNRYQIQVPEAYCANVSPDYRIETTRKGYKRYYTSTVEKLFQKLTIHEEELKRTLDGIMSRVFEQFSSKFRIWTAAIDCIATLDVLQSIAIFVRSLKANDVTVCRPMFLSDSSTPIIDYTDGRHPALVKRNPDYIANDLLLDDRLILLSGANMGGKSTLMRQTALLVILAQVGCFVPASRMRLTPVDRVFSRLGASDRLLEGESTFYTELVETSAMIRCATRDSLLLLDELGRGTSTYDGTAIAYAVLSEINNNIRCRCLFSTHYHSLVRDFQNTSNVRLAHMACKVEKRSADDEFDVDPLKENITFLYKITDGPVGRSYGFNVAKLAGIEDGIIKDAFEKSKELELRCKILERLQHICANEPPSLGKGSTELMERVVSAIS